MGCVFPVVVVSISEGRTPLYILEQTRSSKIPRDVSSSAILAKIEKMADRFKTSGFIIEEELKFCRVTGDLHAPHPYVWYPETALMGIERRNVFIETFYHYITIT